MSRKWAYRARRPRIDDHQRPVLALVEAAGLVGPDPVLPAGVFEGGLDPFGALGEAAGAGGGFVAFVGADEEVVLEERHLTDVDSTGLRGLRPVWEMLVP
jgi:hypothetical protein